jgi:hypothetical protein
MRYLCLDRKEKGESTELPRLSHETIQDIIVQHPALPKGELAEWLSKCTEDAMSPKRDDARFSLTIDPLPK